MILVFGSINVDLVARVAAIARPGETVLSERYETFFGGKGANQAVAAARARRDPALRVVMASAVGDDGFGQAAVANLAANGVETGTVRRVGDPTGCAFITVDAAGENAITVASGANRMIASAAVADDLLRQAAVVVLQMEAPLAETAEIAVRAKRCGARVLLNFAPAAGSLSRQLVGDLLAATDILVANESETLAIHELLGGTGGIDHEAAMSAIARGQGLTGIVTLGARGAAALLADGRLLRVPALAVRPVDTTGAGDTFVGVLAAGLAESRPLGAALNRACAGASLACLTLGAQPGMPDAAAIDRALPGGDGA